MSCTLSHPASSVSRTTHAPVQLGFALDAETARTQAFVAEATARPSGPTPMVSFFSGIEGFGLGMAPHGYEVVSLCEINPAAQRVLRVRHPNVPLDHDIALVESMRGGDGIVSACGFPCTSISKPGLKQGIFAGQTALVEYALGLYERANPRPAALIFENVVDLYSLHRGIGIAYITARLERMGYKWAYRTVDSAYAGVAQRRRRVFILALLHGDPREVVLSDSHPETVAPKTETVDLDAHDCGFYWSEGTRGLGLVLDGIPTIKASSVTPAVLFRDGMVGIPDIRDLERLQALPENWTAPGGSGRGGRGGITARTKLVGNSVTSSIPYWIASRLRDPKPYAAGRRDARITPGTRNTDHRWPKAAWNMGDGVHAARVTENPMHLKRPTIGRTLRYPVHPLSARATAGFLARAAQSTLTFPPHFLDRLRAHHARMCDGGAFASTPGAAPDQLALAA